MNLEDVPSILKNIAEKEDIGESMSLRIFRGLDQERADTKWGMDIENPPWLEAVHNTQSGRCFILGTGPSLTQQMPLLPHLDKETTWTVNRMQFWGDLPFTPNNHVVAEPGPIGGWGRFIFPQYDFPTAINRIAINWWPVTAPGWLWVPKAPDDIQMRWEGFYGLGDTFPPIPTGWASPLTLCQVAAWMGYDEFYFLGIDTTQTGQAWDAIQGRTANPRNIRSILECFDRANRDVRRAGRKIFDCTPGGRINQEGALEYVPLEDVLEVKGEG